MKNILLLMVIALPLLLISCSDDKDEPKDSDKNEYVDLGLPSGTLWATCNVGANKPEEYGDFFAWGETEPKEVYFDYNYKWVNFSKYNSTDGKMELDPEDDAAYVNMGTSWRTPSAEQISELVNNCTWRWTQKNGVNGYLVTGPNRNTMFLPAAGICVDDNPLEDAGSYGCYWTRTQFQINNIPGVYDSLQLEFSSEDRDICSRSIYRYFGHTVRAVYVSQN